MPPRRASLKHTRRLIHQPAGWVLYLAHVQPVRLVVFVHGFGGKAVNTWQRFPEGGASRTWWRTSDLLFVGYDSGRDNITGTAARLRRELPRFCPVLPTEFLEAGEARLRSARENRYRELVLVGHSLGGLVVRRALCDAAQAWMDDRDADPHAAAPAILSARVRLFSPASAGFRPAGALGLIRATPLWTAVNMRLRKSSAYTDLQPNSQILVDTRRRTEELVRTHPGELDALRARIVWANPDDVVLTERYDSDFADETVDRTNHSSVCKPHAAYESPWDFVENGRLT